MGINRVHSRPERSAALRIALAMTAFAIAICSALAFQTSVAQAHVAGSDTTTTVKKVYYKNACDGSLIPATQTIDKSTGASAQFEVTLIKNTTGADSASAANRSCDTGAGKTAPANDVLFEWEVVSGPCIGRKGTATTNAAGKAYFSLDGCGCGTDAIKVKIKKVITVVTTTTKTTTTTYCKTWILLLCIDWDTKSETTVTSTTSIAEWFWFADSGTYYAIWTGCTPPPTGPTGPPPTGPTGPPPTGPTGPPPTGPTGPPPTGPTGPPPTGPTGPPTNPPVTSNANPLPVTSLAIAKTCTKPYVLIKTSVSNGAPRSMVVYVDGKRVGSVKNAGTASKGLQYRLYTSKLSPKAHKVKVIVTYTNGSKSTVTKKFKPCTRFSAVGRAAPRFTG